MPEQEQQLKTLSSTGKPPKARLKSAKEARDIFHILKHDSEYRERKAGIIQGMFDGNPPFNASKMRQHGQAGFANFNTLEGAARKDSAKTPYYDLFTSAEMFAECRTDVSTDSMPAARAARIRAEEFDIMLRSWPSFHENIWMMLDDFIKFNKGILWWPDRLSWHFKRVPWHRLYFPEGASYDPSEWELFAIEHVWPVHRLWNFVADESSQESGWNRSRVIEAIRKAMPKSKENEPMEVQRMLNDHEFQSSFRSNTVQAASLFVREFDGTWSRIMVETEQSDESAHGKPMSAVEAANQSQGNQQKIGDKDWLYFKQGVAEEINELMNLFVFEVHSGSVNALEGLGKRIVSIMQFKDRMRNSQADGVMMRNSILLSAQNAQSLQKAGIIQVGRTTIIPPGFDVQQSQILGDIESTLAVNQDLDAMIDTNTGTYRPHFEKPAGNPESATAASLRFNQAMILTNSAVNRFYLQLDRLYQEIYRRASQEDLPDIDDDAVQQARQFQKRCRERGLSKKQIQDRKPNQIRAMRSIGNGSPGMRQQVASALGQVVPFLGPRGLESWKEMFIAAWGGQQAVERLIPEEDRNNVASRDQWDAASENADMQQGANVILAGWQDHETHAQSHLIAGFGAVQAVQQGADPSTAFIFLQQAIPHTQAHIQQVGREEIKKQFEQAASELEQAFNDVQRAVQNQQQDQQRQQEMSFDQQLKAQQAAAKNQIDQAKAASQMQRDAQRHQQQMEQQDATTAATIRRQTALTEAQLRARQNNEDE